MEEYETDDSFGVCGGFLDLSFRGDGVWAARYACVTRSNLLNLSDAILRYRLAILRSLVYKAEIANSGEGGRKSDT